MNRDTPDPGFSPNIAVLCCEQALADPEKTGGSLEARECRARLVLLPCSSKLEVSHLLEILASGTDGIQVVGCPEGTCRFGVGSRMAMKRVERASALLDDIGFGGGRIAMERSEACDGRHLATLATERARAVRPLGASPMKGDGKR